MKWNKAHYVLYLLLAFFLVGAARHLSVLGEDLSSSYIGCQVLHAGESDHLYSHDPSLFNVVTDPSWTDKAMRADFRPLVLLHPYVQTPLWAFSLEPLCTRTSFPTFNKLFVVAVMLCLSATIWAIARFWTPRLFHVGWIALICCGLYLSEPLKYALFLTQTHIIFFFLTIVALISARRQHPFWAGFLLAIAAAVKITPAFLVIYWLLTKQKKAALSFAVCSVVLAALTVLTVGLNLTAAYIRELARISNVLLVSFNNQSLAAWWMGHKYPAGELFYWHMFHLPSVVKVTSMICCLASAVVGGFFDRRTTLEHPAASPYGAVFTIIGTTVFTPIAWTHYYVVLLAPVMLMLDANLRRRSRAVTILLVTIFALNLYPVAFQAVWHHFKAFSLVRSQFYAGMLSLIGLAFLQARARNEGGMFTDSEDRAPGEKQIVPLETQRL